MKKLLLILLCLPLLFSTCKKEEEDVAPQTQSLEDVIVGTEWCLSNANEDGFLLAEDGKFYLTEKCQSNTQFGNWIIDGDLIKYQFTDNSQEITIVWGEVIEYSESQIKLLNYSDTLLTITDIYILDANDIYGCTDVTVANYNPAAECDDASCCYVSGCTDTTANNYNQFACIDDDSSCCFDDDLCVGSLYQGGIIFYLDGNGGGLIAAPSDQSFSAKWGCREIEISGADLIAIGAGAQNTIDIEAGCTTPGTAADICANLTLGGYSDWFLPSKDELNEMYLNKAAIGGFALPLLDYYWSSTEDGEDFFGNFETSWSQNFINGNQFNFNKNANANVRAVRAF